MPISRLGYVNNGTKKEFPVISALPREMTMAEFALLSDEEKMGDIIVTDYPVDEESDYVEVVADGVKTKGTLLNELLALVDTSRLNSNSCLYWEDEVLFLIIQKKDSTYVDFATALGYSQPPYSITYRVRLSSSSSFIEYTANGQSNKSSEVYTSGKKIRLYYNDAHTFDFNTKAENSIFDPTGTSLSSTNAEDAIKEIDGKIDKGSVTVTTDGSKTYRTMLNELHALIDPTKLRNESYIIFNDNTFLKFYAKSMAGNYTFTTIANYASGFELTGVYVKASNSEFTQYYSGSEHDLSNQTATYGYYFTCVY